MSWLLASGGQSNAASASASVLPMNIQDWFPLGLNGFISLLSKGLSRVFSNTTIWKRQFFGAQPSLWSNSYIHTWLLETVSKSRSPRSQIKGSLGTSTISMLKKLSWCFFFFFFNIYLSIWLCWALVAAPGISNLHCTMWDLSAAVCGI